MIVNIIRIGAYIRWLLKGCKTNLQNEINGNFNATWGGTYETENFIIGIISIVIILGIVIIFFY